MAGTLAMTLRQELESELGYVRSQLERLPLAPYDTVALMWVNRKSALEAELAALRDGEENPMVFGMKTFSEKCIEDKGERYDYDMHRLRQENERLRAENADLRRWKALDKPLTAAMAIVNVDMARLRAALTTIRDTFAKDIAQGYRTNDKQFAIDIANGVLLQDQQSEVSTNPLVCGWDGKPCEEGCAMLSPCLRARRANIT